MEKRCFWNKPGYKPGAPLQGATKTSYLIVGGGVAGLFIAHYLVKKGEKDITIIDKGPIGSGSTGYSAGMLGSLTEIPIEHIEKKHGERSTALYMRMQKEAQKEVRKLVKKEKISCDYEDRDLFFFKDDFGAGEFVEKSISVDPAKFARGVAAYLKRKGVRIYENTPLENVQKKVAYTKDGSISFDHIVYSLGTSQKHPAISNYVTTICVTDRLPVKELRRMRATNRSMFLTDERQSYHYGKLTRDGRLLIGYGDVLTESSETIAPLHRPHLKSIKRFIKEVLGLNIAIDSAWSAAYALSYRRALPYVSINKGNTSVVGGAGTQIASIAAASYFVNTLLEEKHPLKRLYTPRKRSLTA